MGEYNKYHIKISPREFQHSGDKAVSEKIMDMEAFKKALEFVSKNSIEKQFGCICRSSMAQVTSRVSPALFQMVEEASEMFGAPVLPDIFLVRSYRMMLIMVGVKTPLILISTKLLEEISEMALWGIMASEISGMNSGFCQIKLIEYLCNFFSGLLPGTVVQPLSMAFQNWHKYAQYSFDRANLIATGDMDVTMQGVLAGEAPRKVLEGMAFHNPNCGYMKQSREFLKNEGTAMEKLRDYKAVFAKQAFYGSRYLELFRFYQSQYYDLVEDFMD